MESFDTLFPWIDFTIEAWIQFSTLNINLVPIVSLGRDTTNSNYLNFGLFNLKLTLGNVDTSLNYIFGNSLLRPGMHVAFISKIILFM